MSDQANGPRWAPPGDATGDPTVREDTVAFAAEETQRIPREDPPPPPPPPGATSGWAPPPPPSTPADAYGPGAWQPPPAPRRRTGVIIAVIASVVLLVALLGVGAVLMMRATSGPVADEPQPELPDQARPDGVPAPDDVPQDDVTAQTEAVLKAINASEERMIAFQEVVFTAMGDDGTVGDAAAQIARAAQAAGDDLTGLRSDLQALAGGQADEFDGLRDIRDTYTVHMEAWIEYLDAVAGSPALAAPDSTDAEPFWREIEESGNDFVGAMASGLPADVPASLEELARFIVERGFGGFGDGPPGDVV